MDSQPPKVSIIMATKSLTSLYLTDAIESVCKQNYKGPLELIIVYAEGGEEKEAALQYTQDASKHYKRELNCSLYESAEADFIYQRQLGVNQATGDYVCFIDHDDFYLGRKIDSDIQVALELGGKVVYSSFFHADERLGNLSFQFIPRFSHIELLDRCIVNDFALHERSLYQEIGHLNHVLKEAAMYDFWLRVAEKYPDKIVLNPEPTFIYRHHPEQMSSSRLPISEMDIGERIIRASIDRLKSLPDRERLLNDIPLPDGGQWRRAWTPAATEKFGANRYKFFVEEVPVSSFIRDSFRMLEVGVGPGYYIAINARKFKHYVGLDFSLSMIGAAKKIGDVAGNVDLVRVDAEYPPFKAWSFDTVLCVSVIRHLPYAKGLSVIRSLRQLKPNEALFFEVMLTRIVGKMWARSVDSAGEPVIDHSYGSDILPAHSQLIPISEQDPGFPRGIRYLVYARKT